MKDALAIAAAAIADNHARTGHRWTAFEVTFRLNRMTDGSLTLKVGTKGTYLVSTVAPAGTVTPYRRGTA